MSSEAAEPDLTLDDIEPMKWFKRGIVVGFSSATGKTPEEVLKLMTTEEASRKFTRIYLDMRNSGK